MDFKELVGPHSGQNLAEVVKELLVELSLEDKLLAIIGDNATNNESMAKSLGDHLHQKLEGRIKVPL